METYNNAAYNELIQTIVNDAFYVEGLSYDAKIALVRRYTEIILRRMLEYPADEQLTVGNHEVKKKLKSAGYTEEFFYNNLEKIVKPGNKRTHTQELVLATKSDYESSLSALFNLYGYLFYKFFKKYSFEQNQSIVRAFSTLPPIIRDITLSLLFIDSPDNIYIIDRLALAKVKAFSFDVAVEWLNIHRIDFEKLSIQMPLEEQDKLVNRLGAPLAYAIIRSQNKSIYSLEMEKIIALKDAEYVAPYSNFEEAVAYYKQNGIVEGVGADVKEFNDLMEFVYIGRRKIENQADYISDNSILNTFSA